jgi:hypothetical protein
MKEGRMLVVMSLESNFQIARASADISVFFVGRQFFEKIESYTCSSGTLLICLV